MLPSEYEYDLSLSFNSTRRWQGDDELNDMLVYIAITTDGRRLLLTPESFQQLSDEKD